MRNVKITICQQKPMYIEEMCTFLDEMLIAEGENNSDFVLFPENFVPRLPDVVDLKRNTYLRKVSKVVKKHGIFLILGMEELRERDGKSHNTSVLFDTNGEILGAYRKRKLQREEKNQNIIPGDVIGVFNTKICKIAILICYDSEDDKILAETLKNGPKIIFIPIDIKLPVYYRNNLELIKASRETAIESMGKRFFKKAKEHDMIFVRADQPYQVIKEGVNYGTSLIVTPNEIIALPTMEEMVFSINITI